MINVNQKILWLSDYDLDQAPGGAQRSDKIIIDKGKLLGFNILKVNYETFGKHINIHDYDVLITSNVCAVLQKHLWVLDEITKHKHHVRIEHDSNDYLTQENRFKLFSFCKKTFFLTDYHFSFFKQLYGDIFQNVEIVPDPIETDKFYDYGQQREDKILYVGYMHPLKGTSNFFENALRNPDKKYVIAGWSDYQTYNFLSVNVPNIEYLGLVKYEQMPQIYNKYKSLYYDPNLREPFCRSVAEAVICGMLIMTTKQSQIGCIHDIEKYGLEKFKENCKNASVDFWQKI
jgi:glycosyltransferase involved in cell wall biosynthesis